MADLRLWDIVRCPDCLSALTRAETQAVCGQGHTFAIRGGVALLYPSRVAQPPQDYVRWIRQYYAIRFSRRQRAKAELLTSEFVRLTRPVGPVLDVGCGQAEKAALFPAGDYVGIDPINPATNGFTLAHSVPFVCGVGERLPFATRIFSSVLLWGVLDHVVDPAAVFAECARVLRADGALCVLNQVVAPSGKAVPWHMVVWAARKLLTGDLAGIAAIARHSVLSPGARKFTRIQTLEQLVVGMRPHFERVDAHTIDDGHVGIIRAEAPLDRT